MKSFLRFLFVLSLGAVYGVLFAQKPGKKLRSELKKSEKPYNMLYQELKAVDMEAINTIKTWAQNSDELDHLIQSSQSQLQTIHEQLKNMTADTQKQTKKSLESLSKKAQSLIDDIQKSIS